jgi:hypothetical protein
MIAEDERTVSMFPQLHVLPETGPICRYDLTAVADSNGKYKELPFESKVLNKTEGTMRLSLREGTTIDCSDKEWNMQLVAVRCADESAKSEPVSLKVTVTDTNNHSPQFEAPWYTFEVDEGKVAKIARIYATDADCGHPYGKICRYEITNALTGNPFEIDDQGILSTTQPLNRSQAESHILTVVAHDCGMLRSKSTLITIHVRPRCVDGLRNGQATSSEKKEEPKTIHYIPGTGAKRILSDAAEIMMCPREDTCTVKQVDTKVSLHLNPKTDVDFEAAKQCGLKAETVDLLPHAAESKKLKNDVISEDSDDEDLDSNEVKPAEQKNFFNGKSNAIIVSPNTIQKVIPESFTLSFSMKHEAGSKEQQAVKQNLLCETDNFGMNRHHFAVYLRHCKLELLLRREAENAAPEFRAAEWRWETPTVCDGSWHSYAILFADLDNVTLLVDGERFGINERNPEILDDWPLHQTKEHKTRLVVGACWHGRNQTMVQHFKGHLSSMFLLPGLVEPEATIKCMHSNNEKLSIRTIDHLVLGESVVFNHDETQVSLKANSLSEAASLLKEIEYKIMNGKTTQEKRLISIATQVTCVENRTIPLGTYEESVVIVKPDTPRLSVSGLPLVSTNRHTLKTGSVMLPNLQITVTQNIDGVQSDITEKTYLDWCKVHLKPSRDMDLEYFSSPAALIASLNVEFEHDKEGIMLKGEETSKAYMDVLAKIHYYNTHPDTYNKRMYTVHCAMQGGKIVSNEFSVTMTIVDDDLEEAVEKLSSLSKKLQSSSNDESNDDLLKMEKHFEPSFDQLGANRLQNILEMDLPRPKALLSHHGYEVGGQGAVAGGAVAVVVVICIGFLLVLLVIGVVKMRDHPLPKRRRSRKTTMEGMEWDDNGMNITVNPLEDVNKTQQHADVYSEEEESLEDEESYREEDELTEDDDEETEVLPLAENAQRNNGLEWDDDGEPMGGATMPNISKTYRV